MAPTLDEDFWEQHWRDAAARPGRAIEANPYLAEELAHIEPGTALDVGCGEGAEARWLAERGWRVTALDISAEALALAAQRSGSDGPPIDWVQADVTTWTPERPFDLVTTSYAHAPGPQQDLYDRIAGWVAPGGTLLIVGHRHHDHDGQVHHYDHNGHGHGDHVHGDHGPGDHGPGDHGDGPPDEATVTAAGAAAALDPTRWRVVTATEPTRTLAGRGGQAVQLHDVVLRATRLA